MANYDSNYAIAQEISARIGTSPIPFDSVYSIALEIYNELGGEPAQFDSVYSILLGILPLVEGGIASKVIDDHSVVTNKTWSSSKINAEISALAGTANPEVDGKETEDFTFAQELPVSGEEGQQIIIKGENQDTLYKYTSGAWAEQTPDATKLYFDTENEALYSYVTADHQFAPVSMVNTIVVGSNLNSNAALKALKTPGVYSVVQRLHNATKGDYVKNWTLYVESVDYEEYDKSDNVYQRMVSNYTIQKRTWSATRATNDGWSNFSTYYAGEIKDTTTSKYYTWSSSKIAAEIADAGFDVEIVQELPVSGDAHTIYFVPVSGAIGSDVYNEFMYVDGAWEQVGSTRIDLSNYYTKSETDTLLGYKQDTLTAGANISISGNTISAEYEIVSSAEIEDLFFYVNSNEIYYTSYQNRVITPTNTEGLPAIVSNTNVNGKGKIEFASTITSLPEFMFEENPIQTIMLPDTITTLGQGAFAHSSMKTFICPENVTVISMGLFQDTTSLAYVELPAGITSIGNFAFSVSQYGKLTSITYKGTMAQWNAITKGSSWKQGSTKLTVVHCSDGDVNL